MNKLSILSAESSPLGAQGQGLSVLGGRTCTILMLLLDLFHLSQCPQWVPTTGKRFS